ncbi:hypothetical protein [Halorientalis regularis]|jgi:hypothetical protein|uniref:Cox cluster protein n=1 Tax=Halorientalis regularis TaxID=660518 RepID=A0A1G7F4C4_9EURY|nr:hypothetical protein [Halorientalis regularis]SDE70764.1 hypothetical protein SAMN05216218_10120 [Halorientalis regularis]
MTDTPTMSAADRAAMLVGGSLIVVGTVVLGLIETFVGNPSPVPVTNEAGDVIAAPTIPVEIRATLIGLGLLVWGCYGVYRLAAPSGGDATATGTAATAK